MGQSKSKADKMKRTAETAGLPEARAAAGAAAGESAAAPAASAQPPQQEDELQRVQADLQVQKEKRDRLAALLEDWPALVAEYKRLGKKRGTGCATAEEYKAELKEQLATAKDELTELRTQQQALLAAKRTRLTHKTLADLEWHNFEAPRKPNFHFDWVPRAEEADLSASLKRMLEPLNDSDEAPSKARFAPPLINGQMGSGKTRLAVKVCEDVKETFPSKQVVHLMVKLKDIVNARGSAKEDTVVSFPHFLLGVLQDELYPEDVFNANIRAGDILRKFREKTGVAALLLHVDEYQDAHETVLNILSGTHSAYEEHDAEQTLIVPIFSGTSRVDQSAVETASGTVPETITLGAFSGDLAALREQLVASVIEKVKVGLQPSKQQNLRGLLEGSPFLTQLVADLGGIPRFYEFLADVLSSNKSVWYTQHGGLNLDAAKAMHERLLKRIATIYGLDRWRSAVCLGPINEVVERTAVARLFTAALAGVKVSRDAPILKDEPVASYGLVARTGLLTYLGDREGTLALPLVVIAGVNRQLELVEPDCVNPFAAGWPNTELLQLESLRLRINALAFTNPSIPLSELRPRARRFDSPSHPLGDKAALRAPEGGVLLPATLHDEVRNGTNLAQPLRTGADGTGVVSLQGRILLARPNQEGIDSLGLFDAGTTTESGGGACVVLANQAKDRFITSTTALESVRSLAEKALAPVRAATTGSSDNTYVVDIFSTRRGLESRDVGSALAGLRGVCYVTTAENFRDVVGPVFGERMRVYFAMEGRGGGGAGEGAAAASSPASGTTFTMQRRI